MLCKSYLSTNIKEKKTVCNNPCRQELTHVFFSSVQMENVAWNSLTTFSALFRGRRVQVLQFVLEHPQHYQMLMAAGFGAGHAFDSRGLK